MVALLATGGSTNHLIHWVAVARSAGILIDWNDFSDLSDVVPLLTHVYPNGSADVNQFQAAGGTGFVIRELLDAGFMHDDVLTVRAGGIREYTREPEMKDGQLVWHDDGAVERRGHRAAGRRALQRQWRPQAAAGPTWAAA